MATHRLSIIDWHGKPDSSGNVFPEPYSIKATNDNWDPLVLIFNDTATKDGFHGAFTVPQGYVDTAGLVVVWTSTAIINDWEIDFDYRAVGGNDTESLDQATAQESVGTNDTAPGAVNRRMEITMALTDGNFAAGDTVEFILYRDGTDGGDTISAAVIVFDAFFEYNDA